jgi:hypothetical protein
MEHLTQILWLASWPFLIYLTYKLGRIAISIFEKNHKKQSEG